MNRHPLHAALFRSQPSHVPHDDDSLYIDDDALAPAKLGNRSRDLVDSRRRDLAGIALIRSDLIDRPPLNIQRIHCFYSRASCLVASAYGLTGETAVSGIW